MTEFCTLCSRPKRPVWNKPASAVMCKLINTVLLAEAQSKILTCLELLALMRALYLMQSHLPVVALILQN